MLQSGKEGLVVMIDPADCPAHIVATNVFQLGREIDWLCDNAGNPRFARLLAAERHEIEEAQVRLKALLDAMPVQAEAAE